MGYDLKPRNKELDWFHTGAFSWGWWLDQGVGWPLDRFPGLTPGTFLYHEFPDRKGMLDSNDGFRVYAREARDMAKIGRYVVKQQQTWKYHWANLPEDERKHLTEARERHLYPVNVPVRDDFVEHLEAFCDWAEKSGGFRVY